MANVIILGSKKSLSLLRPVPLETENLTGAGNNKPETIVGSNLEYINLKLKTFGGQQKGGRNCRSQPFPGMITSVSTSWFWELYLFQNIGALVVLTV